jgi:hypothetical protein
LHLAAANLDALPSASLLDEGLATMELGTRMFLALILFESTLSALVGLAFVMTTVQPRPVPLDDRLLAPDDLPDRPAPGRPSRPAAGLERGGAGAAPSPSGRGLG